MSNELPYGYRSERPLSWTHLTFSSTRTTTTTVTTPTTDLTTSAIDMLANLVVTLALLQLIAALPYNSTLESRGQQISKLWHLVLL